MHNMIVLGSGCGAVRCLFTETGCEMRLTGRVIHGNARLARVIAVCSSTARAIGLERLAMETGEPENEILRDVRDVLEKLASAGIPLSVWPASWVQEEA